MHKVMTFVWDATYVHVVRFSELLFNDGVEDTDFILVQAGRLNSALFDA